MQTASEPLFGGEFDYCPTLAGLLAKGSATGRSGRYFKELTALSTGNNLRMLRGMLLKLRPKRTLEIGLSFGGSALAFTASHRDLNHPPVPCHVALDPFQSNVWDDCGLDAVERAGLSPWLDFRPWHSSLELPRLLAAGETFDLIYVDGSHLFEDVFVDAYYAVRLLSEGGAVVFDDSQNAHVAKVLRFLRKNLPDVLPELNLAPYRPDGGRNLKYRLARTLRRTQMTAFQRTGETARPWNAPLSNF